MKALLDKFVGKEGVSVILAEVGAVPGVIEDEGDDIYKVVTQAMDEKSKTRLEITFYFTPDTVRGVQKIVPQAVQSASPGGLVNSQGRKIF